MRLFFNSDAAAKPRARVVAATPWRVIHPTSPPEVIHDGEAADRTLDASDWPLLCSLIRHGRALSTALPARDAGQ